MRVTGRRRVRSVGIVVRISRLLAVTGPCRRRRRPRRLLLLAVLPGSAILAAWLASQPGAGAGAGAPHGPGRRGTASGPRVYRDPGGSRLRYPAAMTLEHADSGPGMVTFIETTVANFRQVPAIHSGPTHDGSFIRTDVPLDPQGRFPSDGVAFRIASRDGGPAPIDAVADARFPLTLGTFRPDSYHDGAKQGAPRSQSRPVYADGEDLTATVWIGPHASRAAVATLARVIASLRFAPLRPGTEVGDGLAVLRPARDYPVGSFTLVHARGAVCPTAGGCRAGRVPYYLIHAPGRLTGPLIAPCSTPGACSPTGAFYVVGWTFEDRLGGYRSRCHLRLDLHDQQFYCTNMTARWDRVGRVLEHPPGARVPDPLQFTFAKVAWDGHLVFVPGLDEGPPRARYARALWPGS